MADSDIKEVEQLMGLSEKSQQSLVDAANAHNSIKSDKDRSLIVQCVVITYTVVICLCALNFAYKSWWCGEAAFNDFFEVIKVAVMPVLTLVIGYYFARANSSK